MALSKRQLEILRALIAAEDADDHDHSEIVCDGIQCWLGLTRVHAQTVKSLLMNMLVTRHSDNSGNLFRYTVNGCGRAIAKDPGQYEILLKAIMENQQIMVTKDGRIIPMPRPS